ncbi:DUF4337 family protein [Lichenibacterium dinghuense]|uniref:DUF4337 family protein n=1 Tax=Lichenibacterium dinghuense TaxID=2895977 RepID=UPI001F1C8F67|nr:DUF4337 family protein [Lichenibacterium sp. 6Y81]
MDDQTSEQMEHREHAEHAAHSGDPLLLWVSATIAILAVVAASVGSLETIESGTAISKKSESVLLQNRATDRWSYFQAQSIKKNMYDIAKAANPGQAEAFEAKARGYEKDGEGTREKAEELDRESDALLRDGDHHEKRHHVLTAGVTLLHVGIAVATLSIIMRGRRWPWYASMALGAAGAAVAGYAYLV